MKKFPIYLLLIAVYPVLSLYAHNISEVNLGYILRPALVALVLLGIIFSVAWIALRDVKKSAIIATIIFLAINSYGALYTLLRPVQAAGISLARHRILLPVLVILVIALVWIFLVQAKRSPRLIQGLNPALLGISLALILLPAVQILLHLPAIKLPVPQHKITQLDATSKTSIQPDVYYILLDSYARADYIQEYMNYDNQPFLQQLEEMGFFIGDCSLSNYSYTRLSLSSALNMNYLEQFAPEISSTQRDESLLDPHIIDNLVVNKFREEGYQFAAFETGYPFTEFTHADAYLTNSSDYLTAPYLTAFEVLLLNNTVVTAGKGVDWIDQKLGLGFEHMEKYQRQKFILSKMPSLADIEGPTFSFIHLVTTHRPFIFAADGSILVDQNYYVYDGYPLNDEYFQKGYQDSLTFTNREILEIVKEIRSRSTVEPVIILHGDHGVKPPGRSSILLAVSGLPDASVLYPEISPVNLFRLVFNQLMGEKYELLPDLSYYSLVNKKPFKLHQVEDAANCEIR